MKRNRATISVDLTATQKELRQFGNDVEIFYEIIYLENGKHATMDISLEALQMFLAHQQRLTQQKKP